MDCKVLIAESAIADLKEMSFLPSTCSSQRSHGKDFIVAERFQTGFWNCGDCDCIAESVEDFDRITALAIR